MADLRFSRTASAAVKGADTVVFLAPQRRVRKGWLTRAVDAPWVRLLARAAKDAEAGPRGALFSALNPEAGPKRLVLIVLPDETARYNCPARSVHADELLKKAELGVGTTAVIACAEKAGHALPLGRALARAWPLYSRATGKKAKRLARFCALDSRGAPSPLSKAERAIVDYSRWAARLVDMPTAELTTTDFVRETRKAARGLPHLTVSVIGAKDMLAKGMGGLHAVGRTA
ncbi:MAG: hypothetical protein P1V36_11880, partial [Planctomycetota bacterium]|nr:hypothetical protein [Planctomycetota bacterium]